MRKIKEDKSSGSGRRLMTLVSIWAVILIAVGGFAAAAFMAGSRPESAFALCQASPLKAASTTLVVVDATDTFTDDQQRRLKLTVEAERDRLPEGGRFVLVSLNPDAAWQPTQLISVCNPGKGETTNSLFVTRSKVEKRWQTLYADPIDKAVDQSLERGASERSPIIITLAAVLARADFDTRAMGRRLVIVSDLLEHERNAYSQLRGGDFWSAYQASSLPKSARLNLQGVSVAVDYLQRGKFAGIQGPRHQAFWERLLKEAGANEITFLGMAAAPALPANSAAPRADASAQNGRR